MKDKPGELVLVGQEPKPHGEERRVGLDVISRGFDQVKRLDVLAQVQSLEQLGQRQASEFLTPAQVGEVLKI
jgi:hypothetical protein